MKKNSCIRIVLLTIILLSTLTYCKKDTETNIGKLSISFYNHPPKYSDVVLYSMENTDISICVLKLDIYGNAEKDLNIGNYYIKVYSGTFYSSIGFQINPGKTTKIYWGVDNGAEIQE
ncbi:MAG: hypothetical protein HOO91_05050 [Bacteroidales bacterium]|nr:hypothetical protein [Bacteroidales bacterium]